MRTKLIVLVAVCGIAAPRLSDHLGQTLNVCMKWSDETTWPEISITIKRLFTKRCPHRFHLRLSACFPASDAFSPSWKLIQFIFLIPRGRNALRKTGLTPNQTTYWSDRERVTKRFPPSLTAAVNTCDGSQSSGFTVYIQNKKRSIWHLEFLEDVFIQISGSEGPVGSWGLNRNMCGCRMTRPLVTTRETLRAQLCFFSLCSYNLLISRFPSLPALMLS